MRDLYELYALGLLEEPERSEVEAELASGSAEAHLRLREALENNAILLSTAPPVDPPPALRARILQATGGEAPKRGFNWSWLWAPAAAAFAAIAAYTGSQLSTRSTELASVREQLNRVELQAADSNVQLARARAMLSFLNEAETRVVTFGPKDPKPPRGKVLINPGRGVLLVASNLPPAPAGKIYEMWVIPPGANPQPAGLFQSEAGGNALHLHEVQLDPSSKIAVTLEPESGSPGPTTTPLFVARL